MIVTSDRFWARVDQTGDCWPWMGARSEKGYGRVRGMDGRLWRANRLVWEMVNGPIQPGLLVLHTCDNPPCVRPSHLWLGTHADNRRDASAKGRLGRPRLRGTTCQRGHAFTPENTYEYPNRPGRRCRACHHMWVEAHRHELNRRRRVA